jgi:hypothetical protein
MWMSDERSIQTGVESRSHAQTHVRHARPGERFAEVPAADRVRGRDHGRSGGVLHRVRTLKLRCAAVGEPLTNEAMTAARVDDEPSMAAVIALTCAY